MPVAGPYQGQHGVCEMGSLLRTILAQNVLGVLVHVVDVQRPSKRTLWRDG